MSSEIIHPRDYTDKQVARTHHGMIRHIRWCLDHYKTSLIRTQYHPKTFHRTAEVKLSSDGIDHIEDMCRGSSLEINDRLLAYTHTFRDRMTQVCALYATPCVEVASAILGNMPQRFYSLTTGIPYEFIENEEDAAIAKAINELYATILKIAAIHGPYGTRESDQKEVQPPPQKPIVQAE